MIVGFELEPHVPAVTESRQASRRVWKHGIKTPSSEEIFLDGNMVLLDVCLSHGRAHASPEYDKERPVCTFGHSVFILQDCNVWYQSSTRT